jgi:hypothetical protein
MKKSNEQGRPKAGGDDENDGNEMKSPPNLASMSAVETAPGVRLLRELWDIPREKKRQERIPKDVSSDIYDTGSKANVPRRTSSHQ